MATLSELLAARDSAGSAYASAAQGLVDAWIELAAYDAAISNMNVPGREVHNFGELPTVLAHAEYLPQATRNAMTSPNVVSPTVRARTEQLIASYAP